MRPPFKRDWSWSATVLLEFSPIIVGNRLFIMDNAGVVTALNRTTGKRVWKRDMGYLSASSPAYGNGKVFVTVLERDRGGGSGGRVAALRARDGKVEWSRDLSSRTESSPLFVDGRVYFGAENGTVYSMYARGGAIEWTFDSAGAVKGGPALADGRLYFGTYGGNVYAISRRTGRQIWHAGTSGANLGLSAGNFYSSPAVAYGRVYIGNTDGNMYSFSAESGKLAWRRGTGSYVYASPAVAQVRGGKPTVYFGSYDGTFYALDARSGATRWAHKDGGNISGAATVVGDIVYYSNRGNGDTQGMWARTGKRSVPLDARRLQPGGLRRRDDLPHRLLVGRRLRAQDHRPGAPAPPSGARRRRRRSARRRSGGPRGRSGGRRSGVSAAIERQLRLGREARESDAARVDLTSIIAVKSTLTDRAPFNAAVDVRQRHPCRRSRRSRLRRFSRISR